MYMVKVELLLEVIGTLRSLTNRLQMVVDQETSGERTLTIEDVRAVLVEKSCAGYIAEVKALIRQRGAGRLSEIDPAEYPALLAEVKSL